MLSLQNQQALKRYKKYHSGKHHVLYSIPIFFIALKLNISFIIHVLRFEGIIFAINVVYDLEVLVQIDTACARVYKLDLSSSSQQWGPHFPFVWQTGRAQLIN